VALCAFMYKDTSLNKSEGPISTLTGTHVLLEHRKHAQFPYHILTK
jgi:hypothetical protein